MGNLKRFHHFNNMTIDKNWFKRFLTYPVIKYKTLLGSKIIEIKIGTIDLIKLNRIQYFFMLKLLHLSVL